MQQIKLEQQLPSRLFICFRIIGNQSRHLLEEPHPSFPDSIKPIRRRNLDLPRFRPNVDRHHDTPPRNFPKRNPYRPVREVRISTPSRSPLSHHLSDIAPDLVNIIPFPEPENLLPTNRHLECALNIISIGRRNTTGVQVNKVTTRIPQESFYLYHTEPHLSANRVKLTHAPPVYAQYIPNSVDLTPHLIHPH